MKHTKRRTPRSRLKLAPLPVSAALDVKNLLEELEEYATRADPSGKLADKVRDLRNHVLKREGK